MIAVMKEIFSFMKYIIEID